MTTSAARDPRAVADVMHAGVVSCRPDATLHVVAGVLAAHRIHAVVVTSDEDEAALGIVTDRDVLWSYAHGELDRVAAGDVATGPAITLRPDAGLRHAAELMSRLGTSHLLVAKSARRRPVGIVSSLDVVDAISFLHQEARR